MTGAVARVAVWLFLGFFLALALAGLGLQVWGLFLRRPARRSRRERR